MPRPLTRLAALPLPEALAQLEDRLGYYLSGKAMTGRRPLRPRLKRDLGQAEIGRDAQSQLTMLLDPFARANPEAAFSTRAAKALGVHIPGSLDDADAALTPELAQALTRDLRPQPRVETVDRTGAHPVTRYAAISPDDPTVQLKDRILALIRQVPLEEPDATYSNHPRLYLERVLARGLRRRRTINRPVEPLVDRLEQLLATSQDPDAINRGHRTGMRKTEGYDPEAEKARLIEGAGDTTPEQVEAAAAAREEKRARSRGDRPAYSPRAARYENLRELEEYDTWAKETLAKDAEAGGTVLTKAQRKTIKAQLPLLNEALAKFKAVVDEPLHQSGETYAEDYPEPAPYRRARKGRVPLQTGPTSEAPYAETVPVKLPSGRILEGRIRVPDTNPITGRLYQKDEVSTRITPEGYQPVKSLSFSRGPYADLTRIARNPQTGAKALGEAVIELPYDPELDALGWVDPRPTVRGYRSLETPAVSSPQKSRRPPPAPRFGKAETPDEALDLWTGDAEDLIGAYPPRAREGTILTGLRPILEGPTGPKGVAQPAAATQPPGWVTVRVHPRKAKDGTFRLKARVPQPASTRRPPLNLPAEPPPSAEVLRARLDALLSERPRVSANEAEDTVSPLERLVLDMQRSDAIAQTAKRLGPVKSPDFQTTLGRYADKVVPNLVHYGTLTDEPVLTPAMTRPTRETRRPRPTQAALMDQNLAKAEARQGERVLYNKDGSVKRTIKPRRAKGTPEFLPAQAAVPMVPADVTELLQAMRTGTGGVRPVTPGPALREDLNAWWPGVEAPAVGRVHTATPEEIQTLNRTKTPTRLRAIDSRKLEDILGSVAGPLLAGVGALGASLALPDKAEAARQPRITTAIPWTAKPVSEWTTRTPQVPISTPGKSFMRHAVDERYELKEWARRKNDELLAQEIQVLSGGGQGRVLDYARPIVEAMQGLNEDELTALDALLASRAANRAVDEGATKAQRLRQEAVWLSNDPKRRREARARIVEARALERAGQGGRLAPESVVGTQKPQEIESYLLTTYGRDSLANVLRLERRIYDSANAMLDELERAEILTKAEVQAYRDRGDYLWRHRKQGLLDPAGRVYTLKRLLPQHLIKESQRRGQRLSTRQEQIIHKLLGAEPEREYDRPLRNALSFIDDTVREVNKNYLARRITDLGLRTEPDQWRIIKSPDEADAANGVIAYQHQGKTVYVEAPPLIADLAAMGNLNMTSQAMRIGSLWKRWFQAMAATANPAFGAVQVIKDIPVALARPEYAKYQGGLTPDDLTFFKEAWLRAVTEAYQDAWTPGRAEFHRAGAYLHEISRPGVPMDRLGLELPETGMRRIPQLMEQGFEKISEKTLEPVEEATKRASYELLRRKGFGQHRPPGGNPALWSPIPIDQVEAAFQARLHGGSPDFNQRGLLMADLGNWYMFLNPQIQGITRTVTLADLSNPQNLPKLSTWIGSLSALMAGTAAWNYQFVNPDTGRPEPEEWTESDKAQALQIILPEGLGGGIEQLSDGRRRWKAIKIPLSHEFQPAIVPVRMLIDQLTANPNANPAQAVVDFGMNFVPGNVQMDLEAPFQSLGRRLGAGANPMLRLPAEYWTNKQFFTDTPIVGRRVQELPAKFQSTARTTPTSKAIGEATGLSPDVLDWLVRGAAPGLGEMAYTALDPMLREPTPPQATGVTTETLARLPIAGTLLRRFLPSLARGQASHSDAEYLYELAPRTQAAIAKLNQMAELRPTELDAFQAENPNLVLMAGANTAVQRWLRAIREVDDEIELLQQRPDLPVSAAERTERLNQLAVHRGQLMMQARQELEALGLQ